MGPAWAASWLAETLSQNENYQKEPRDVELNAKALGSIPSISMNQKESKFVYYIEESHNSNCEGFLGTNI